MEVVRLAGKLGVCRFRLHVARSAFSKGKMYHSCSLHPLYAVCCCVSHDAHAPHEAMSRDLPTCPSGVKWHEALKPVCVTVWVLGSIALGACGHG